MKNILFVISIVLLLLSFYLLVEFPNSNRMSLIAGVFSAIGIGANILVYSISKPEKKHSGKSI